MSKEAAIQCVRANVARFDEPDIQKSFAKWKKTVQYRFTDIGECCHIVVTEGRAELRDGEAPNPDMEWILSTETMVKLGSGEIGGMAAFTSGAVKMKGSVTDMLKWRKVTRQ